MEEQYLLISQSPKRCYAQSTTRRLNTNEKNV